jgi:hypothetical protein
MSTDAAETLVMVASVYAATGLLFAVSFVWCLVERLDPTAEHGTIGFRLIIATGVVLLWPYLLSRLARRAAAPPDEWNAHRAAARGGVRS